MPTAQRPSQCCSNPVIPLPLAASTENALIAQFKALGDPTRFGILRLIAAQRDPICACDIVARFELRQPTISHHMKILHDAGLITVERHGGWAWYAIVPDAVDTMKRAFDVFGPDGMESPSRPSPRNEKTIVQLREKGTSMAQMQHAEDLRETVRGNYAARALDVQQPSSCCGGPAATSCCGGSGGSATSDPITGNLYSELDAAELPSMALLASLGCGNPTALAELGEGERVLDLGSGGGIDVLLSARRVGPTGHAYGLDMTDEMLALAERNKAEADAENVTFLKGQIEAIPLPEKSVDVVISNCVINLSTDKAQVLREAHRVLSPGGRFAVSDVVVQGELPADLRTSMEAWVGCVAGALEESEYRDLLDEAGFDQIDIEVTRVYDPHELAESLQSGGGCCCGSGVAFDEAALAAFDASGGRVVSAFVRARKP